MKRIDQVRFVEEYKWAAAGSLDSLLAAAGSLEASGLEEMLASALKDDGEHVAVLVLCLVLFLGGLDL